MDQTARHSSAMRSRSTGLLLMDYTLEQYLLTVMKPDLRRLACSSLAGPMGPGRPESLSVPGAQALSR